MGKTLRLQSGKHDYLTGSDGPTIGTGVPGHRGGCRAGVTSIRSLLLLSIILPAFASPVAAAAPRVVDVEGQAASADDIAFYHCHDLDAPAIHCFLTEARLQAAIGLETARSAPGTVLRPYVEMFADISYGGASFIASLDYPDLGSIGWNNRVSSFIGLNDYVGTFYQDASYHGAYWHFLPDVHVNYVGDFWNDTFSSVTRG